MANRQWIGGIASVGICLALVLTACGNDGPTDEELFAQAEYLILEQRFDEAIPLLRLFLVRNPGHSGAHYYLGRCYYASPRNFWFTIADGELRTALQMFKEDGRTSRIERFDDVYFELICHLDMARVRVQQAVFLIETGGNPAIARSLLRRAEEAIERAREIDPDSPDVELMQEGIDEIRRAIASPEDIDTPGVLI